MATTNKTSKTAPRNPAREETVEDTPVAAPKKKRGIVKLLLGLVLLLGGAGGGAWYYLHLGNAAEGGKGASVKKVPSRPPVFVPLDSFTVNLQPDEASTQFLQVGLSLKVTDSNVVEAIKLHTPEIRNRVLLLLSSKKASDINTLEGKNKLSAELANTIMQPLAEHVPAKAIDAVLFTSFVIQ